MPLESLPHLGNDMFLYYVSVRYAEAIIMASPPSIFSLKTSEVSEDEGDHLNKRVKTEYIPLNFGYCQRHDFKTSSASDKVREAGES